MAGSVSDPQVRRTSSHSGASRPDAATVEADLLTVLDFYAGRGRLLRQTGELAVQIDPPVVEKRLEAAIDLLERAEREQDKTPQLFVFGHEALQRVGSLPWVRVVSMQRDDLVLKSAKPDAKRRKTPEIPKERTLEFAFELSDGVIDRVRKICASPKADPKEAKRRHQRVFQGRKPQRSKAGFTAELRAISAAITAWSTEAPLALHYMLPDLATVLHVMENALPQTPGREGPATWVWSDDVLESALAAELMLASLLEHAIATATPSRRAAFQRAIDPQQADRAAPEEEDCGDGEDPAHGADSAAADDASSETKEAKRAKGGKRSKGGKKQEEAKNGKKKGKEKKKGKDAGKSKDAKDKPSAGAGTSPGPGSSPAATEAGKPESPKA